MLLLMKYLKNLETKPMYKICFFFFISLAFCQTPPKKEELKFIKAIQLNIPEISGLTWAHGNLFTISDDLKSVFEISLEGQLLDEYSIGNSGFEGITYNSEKDVFYLVNEDKRKLYEFSLSEGLLSTVKIKGAQNRGKNKGLEGVCYNTNDKRLYLVNEAGPKQILQLSPKNKKISKKIDLKFGDDISGVCYDKKRNVFWVLSDESQAVYKISLDGKQLKKYKLPIEKPEGLVLGPNCETLYIVSDTTAELFVFKL